MVEYIDRQAALDMVRGLEERYVNNLPPMIDKVDVCNALDTLPFADVQPVRHGIWEERKVSDKNCIDEWQTACCSVCHKYHTTPYMYYFDNYNYCPNCGARMDGD